jgi:hypothetical protein
MNLKFSLKDLLLLTALISVACAALANTNIWWHSIVVTATLSGMTGLVIGAALHAGSHRAFACGWLLFAAGYLALVFGPWTGSNLGANFITSKALAHLELQARRDNPSPPVLNVNGLADLDSDGNLDLIVTGNVNQAIWTTYSSAGFANVQERSWASNYTTFQSTGHWLFASVFGYCGAHLAALLFYFRSKAAKSRLNQT